MSTKNSTKEEEYDGSGSYEDAFNGTSNLPNNNQPKKRINVKELAKKANRNIITDNKLREVVLAVDDNEEVAFSYKPLLKTDFLIAQATGDPGKVMDYILSHTLWDNEKGKHGDFMSIEEIDKGIPIEWQVLILNEIVAGSGHVLTKDDQDF